MHVVMEDRLTSRFPIELHDRDAIGFEDPEHRLGEGLRMRDDRLQIRGGGFQEGRGMVLRDNQGVSRMGRKEVHENQNLFVFVDTLCGGFALHDRAEDTILFGAQSISSVTRLEFARNSLRLCIGPDYHLILTSQILRF